MSELTNAIRQICEEKALSYEAVLATIESALAAAYRKDYGEKNQNIKVEFDPNTAKSKVFDVKTVVEDLPVGVEVSDNPDIPVDYLGEDGEEKRFNPKTEIQLSDARLVAADYQIGDEVRVALETKDDYGRMAAQTAKQVIIQRLREAERDMVFNEFKDKENEVITGVVTRREGRLVLIDLGKATGIIPPEEQVQTDHYRPGERIKVFVREVRLGMRGAEIILSRTADEILKKVFYLEIPEIANGLIEIKGVAREAGSRAKVAIMTDNDNIDPIGSCVGQRGSRIQTIIRELGGEKIDIIEYDADIVKYIANAMSPAKVSSVLMDEKGQRAVIRVPEDQLSLAIGKEGQNVRLASRLTGWRLDIAESEAVAKSNEDGEVADEAGAEATDEAAEITNLSAAVGAPTTTVDETEPVQSVEATDEVVAAAPKKKGRPKKSA